MSETQQLFHDQASKAITEKSRLLITAVDFLVYSMACAELRAIDADQTEFIHTLKAVISANLRTLLS